LEPEARYKLVGGAVLLLVLAMSLASIWLARSGVASEFRFYTIYFQKQSLEGLQVGSDVNMQGLKVGRVESFEIDRSNINRVQVQIRVARHTPVSTNSSAVIARNLVTGIARINLETPGKPGPALEDVPNGEAYPVIAEGTSDFDQLTRTANSLVISAEKSFAQLGSFLDDENRVAFSQALTGIRDLAGGLNQRLDSFERTSVSLGAAAQTLAQTAQSFRMSSERIAGLVEQFGRQAIPVAKQAELAIGDTRDTLAQIRQAVSGLTASTRALEAELASLSRIAQGSIDVGALELRATAQQLRSGVEQLSRTLDRLQDPRSLLLGPTRSGLGPGEKLE
jgi:phospholipid/cholesterol/gamma-HCH transport system substrate-binding protein